MATTINLAQQWGEQRFVLRHVSWATYEGLLADHADAVSPRFTYSEGMLEIMSPSSEHEELNEALATIADIVAEERQVEFKRLGSTTFRRRDLERGTEPDECFYIQNVERIRGKKEIDLSVDPPPDLVIEVEITSPAVPKLPVYARLGVPEIWLHDGRAPRILRLAADQYASSDRSGVFPCLTESVLSEFLEQSKTLSTLNWRRVVRTWARERIR
ncbi:MAG: Uma2 family endonuclease [Terriglobia bacterium]|jgi:Uma2 family endonuclease